MIKRGHDAISRTEDVRDSASGIAHRIQQRLLRGLLDQGETAPFGSLKAAPGLGRRKLSRWHTATSESEVDDMGQLNAEVIALNVSVLRRHSSAPLAGSY